MNSSCTFQIPRGNTNRYVYIFVYKGSYYEVTLKVLYFGKYRTISKVNILTKNINTYINTVVATIY